MWSSSSPSAPPAELPRRMVGIDAVRAVAALAVVVSHIRRVPEPGPGEPGTVNWLTSVVQQSLGAWGVGLFFVLSGLCIHLPMARRQTSEPSATLALRPYLARRFVRIYPPHLVALVLSALLALALPAWSLVGSSLLSKPTPSQFGLHLVMLHSFVPGAIGSINSVLWTIAVETHFYLLYPLLLLASRRIGFVPLTAGLCVVSLLARAVGFLAPPWFATIAETNFICRLWEWSLGCCLAEALATRGAPTATSLPRFAALCVGSLALSPILRLGLRAMLGVHLGRALGNEAITIVGPMLYAVVVLHACGLADVRAGLFRALVALGIESYSLYLCHPLVLASWGWAFAALGLPHLAMALTALPVTLLGSMVFFRTVERRFLARAATVSTSPV